MADQDEIPFERRCEPYLNGWGPYRLTRDPVSATAIRRFCEVAEDGNPVYWDEAYARTTRFGRLIAPPQSLFAMTFGAWWTPDHVRERLEADTAALNKGEGDGGQAAIFALCDRFGFVVNTVAGQEVEYLAPFGPGDGRLKVRSMVTAVSAEKQVRAGTGVFVTSVTEYRTEAADVAVGRSTMVLLRYRPREGAQ